MMQWLMVLDFKYADEAYPTWLFISPFLFNPINVYLENRGAVTRMQHAVQCCTVKNLHSTEPLKPRTMTRKPQENSSCHVSLHLLLGYPVHVCKIFTIISSTTVLLKLSFIAYSVIICRFPLLFFLDFQRQWSRGDPGTILSGANFAPGNSLSICQTKYFTCK